MVPNYNDDNNPEKYGILFFYMLASCNKITSHTLDCIP